jgi:N-acetylglutamate synthase-like GNAT family acetyltransferase
MIRDMLISDIPDCVEIVRLNWGNKVAERADAELNRLILDNMASYFVFTYPFFGDDKIVGFIGVMPSWIMTGIWDLIWVNTHPNYQGTGIGKALVLHGLSEIKEYHGTAVHLMTKEYNFFKKFGFKMAFLYDSGWALMAKQLHDVEI